MNPLIIYMLISIMIGVVVAYFTINLRIWEPHVSNPEDYSDESDLLNAKLDSMIVTESQGIVFGLLAMFFWPIGLPIYGIYKLGDWMINRPAPVVTPKIYSNAQLLRGAGIALMTAVIGVVILFILLLFI